MLKHADNIIVWNYFYLEDLPPTVSESIAKYLAENFVSNSYYVSIGLWGKKEQIDPQTFTEAIKSTLKGGVKRIWITPDYIVTDKHWESLLPFLKGENLEKEQLQ